MAREEWHEPQRLRPHGWRRGAIQRQGGLKVPAPLTDRAGAQPKETKGTDQPEGPLALAGCERPLQRRAEVCMLMLEPLEPAAPLMPLQRGFRHFRQCEVIRCVSA